MAARKIPFQLEMKDGVKVRDISEFKQHFDVEKVVGYFLDGKLQKWLEARWYEDESEAVSELDENDLSLAKKLCEIFDVKYEEKEIAPEEIVERNVRISKLKQYTDDEEIIRNIDNVAFDQEELAELFEKNVENIYLCEGKFKIPKSKRGLTYELIGTVTVDGLDEIENERDGKVHTKKYETEEHIIDSNDNNLVGKRNITGVENAEQWIAHGDNILYVDKNDGYIYYRKGSICKKISQTNTFRYERKLWYVDDKKAIWYVDYAYYYSDLSGQEELIVSSDMYNRNLIEYITVEENIFWFLVANDNRLYKVDLNKKKEQQQSSDTTFFALFRRKTAFESALVQENVWYAKREGDYIYTYAINDRKDKFYRINLAEVVLEYISNGSSDFGFEVYVKKFEVSNQKIVYVAGKLFGDCQLYVLDLITRKVKKLDDNLPSANINTYELYLQDEWLYYGVYDFGGKYLEKNKIKYDGTGKTRVNDNEVLNTYPLKKN